MAKKQKSIKKAKNQQKSKRLQQTPEELVARAENAISAGKGREAIEFAKLAAKKQAVPEETIQILLFRAYLAREKQLRKKNMRVEADAVNRQAIACISDPGRLDEPDLVLFMALAEIDKVFDAYAAYLAHRPSSLAIERQLVNRLLQTEQWNLLERIDPETPLRKDAQFIPAATKQMNAGQWESALRQLQNIPRSSPFAPLRMLCRAMSAFYAEDDKGLTKALSMIPESFLLYPLTSVLRDYIAAGTGNISLSEQQNSALQLLFDGPVDPGFEVKQILSHSNLPDVSKAASRINRLAHDIYPEDPETCKKSILEILSNASNEEIPWTIQHSDLVMSLMGDDEAKSLMLRKDMHSEMPLFFASLYIEILPRLFSDPHQRAIAKSLVLLKAMHISRQTKSLEDELYPDHLYMNQNSAHLKTKWHLLGVNKDDPADIYLQMAKEGIASDPDNRQWYEQIVEMPRFPRNNQKIVEEAFLKMAEHFPDDPSPYIELAKLYTDKKAHRKAEKAIEQAAALAPYDNRVIDRKVVLYLTSAQINFERGKLLLARADLEKAIPLESRPAIPFIRGKTLLLDLAQAPWDAADILASTLSNQDPFDRLYTMILLMINILSGSAAKILRDHDRITTIIQSHIDADMATIGQSLSSRQVVQLVSPVPREFSSVIPGAIAKILGTVFSEPQTTDLLRQTDDADILFACDALLHAGRHKIIKEELSSRLNKHGYEKYPIMTFYHLVLKDLSGQSTDAIAIIDLIEASPEKTVYQLKEAAERLAPHAGGVLRDALLYFNFYMLDPDPGMDDEDFIDDFDDDLIFSEDQELSIQMLLSGNISDMSESEIIDGIEYFVDRIGCRGMSSESLRMAKNVSLECFPMLENFYKLLPDIPKSIVKKLSREARALLF